MLRNAIANAACNELPINAPNKVAEAIVMNAAFLGDSAPKYSRKERFKPMYPNGSESRKKTVGTLDACNKTLKRMSPEIVPATITPDAMRRADLSG